MRFVDSRETATVEEPSPVSVSPTRPAPAAASFVRGGRLFRDIALAEAATSTKHAQVLEVAPPWLRAVFWLAASVVTTAIGLACFIDVEQSGFARGILRGAGGVQAVSSPAAGIVLDVGPRSGDLVEPGTLLLRIDSAQTRASLLETERQITLAEQRLAQFAQRRGREHEKRIRALEQRAALLDSRSHHQRASVERARARQETFGRLRKEGLTSNLERLEVDDAVDAQQREALKVGEERAGAELQIATIRAEVEAEQSQLQSVLQQATDKRDALQVQLGQMEVRAPRRGRVEALGVKPGDTVAVGTTLAKIVPTDAPRQIVVFAPERDRAFLHEGDLARIEVDQLPAAEFGTVRARISRVASDLASPSEIAEALGEVKLTEPSVRVELTVEPGAELDRMQRFLQPGSLVSARCTLRKRRIITVAFEPLRRFLP